MNYVFVRPSDIASIYVHGSQEKIGELFEDARKNAPTILFFDELDAIMPNRSNGLNHNYASEVNEFLAQMSNSGDYGVFIIGATNRPDMIDPAILRAGRLDKIVYVSPPDFEARKSMFAFYLDKRPCENDIDHNELASLTVNRVFSDIRLLVDEASRSALESEKRITMQHLKDAIAHVRPTVSLEVIESYEQIRKRLDDKHDPEPVRTIGFAVGTKSKEK